jgi:hypothetical protein
MNKTRKRYQKIIENIEINMILETDNIWIKIIPIVRTYIHSNLSFILNDEYYNFEIYDKEGIESHQFYFEGKDCNPSFILNVGEKNFRMDFKGINIKIVTINNKFKDYIKNYCNLKSSDSNCWAKSVYFTSRPDKFPFDEI